jgi:hypothetical protein
MIKFAKAFAALAGIVALSACSSVPSSVKEQPAQIPAALSIAHDGPCCGPITPKAQRILDVLDASNVENLWQRDTSIEWDTGEPKEMKGWDRKETHCSAFSAAMGMRLGVYMLRPPYHAQMMLASAQGAWLRSPDASNVGWWKVDGPAQAQALANSGRLVVIVFESPDSSKHGHIAIVRPDAKRTLAEIEESGTEITQAGGHNYLHTTEARGFHGHEGAWPNGVEYFAHDLPEPETKPPA